MPFSEKVIEHNQTTGFLKADPLQIDNKTILVTMLSARWLRNLALNEDRELPCNPSSVFHWIRSQTGRLTIGFATLKSCALFRGKKKKSISCVYLWTNLWLEFLGFFFFSEMEMIGLHLQFSTKPFKNALGKQLSLPSRY